MPVVAVLAMAVLLATFRRVTGVNTYATPLTGILPPALSLLCLHASPGPAIGAWDRHMACHVSMHQPVLALHLDRIKQLADACCGPHKSTAVEHTLPLAHTSNFCGSYLAWE